jgi:hypothetical protein
LSLDDTHTRNAGSLLGAKLNSCWSDAEFSIGGCYLPGKPSPTVPPQRNRQTAPSAGSSAATSTVRREATATLSS